MSLQRKLGRFNGYIQIPDAENWWHSIYPIICFRVDINHRLCIILQKAVFQIRFTAFSFWVNSSNAIGGSCSHRQVERRAQLLGLGAQT